MQRLLVDQEVVERAGLPQLGVDLVALGVGLEAVLAVVLGDQARPLGADLAAGAEELRAHRFEPREVVEGVAAEIGVVEDGGLRRLLAAQRLPALLRPRRRQHGVAALRLRRPRSPTPFSACRQRRLRATAVRWPEAAQVAHVALERELVLDHQVEGVGPRKGREEGPQGKGVAEGGDEVRVPYRARSRRASARSRW